MAKFPRLKCPICESFDNCRKSKFRPYRQDGKCFAEIRHMDLDIQRQHLENIAKIELVADFLPDNFVDDVLSVVKTAEGFQSLPLEYSVTYAPASEHWFRFSLSYSDEKPEFLPKDANNIDNLISGFYPENNNYLLSLFHKIELKPILQLLYGIDIRKTGKSRQKAYLRLAQGESEWKLSLIQRIFPEFTTEDAAMDLDSLRLLGLDLGKTPEKTSIKLYFTKDNVDQKIALLATGNNRFIKFISKNREKLRELLLIQRILPNTEIDNQISEVDLHLLKNEIDLPELLQFMAKNGMKLPMRNFIELYKKELIVSTSVTFPIDNLEKNESLLSQHGDIVKIAEFTQEKPKSIVLVNPPVAVVDKVQLDFYADALPFGLYQIAAWLETLGHNVKLVDMMGYGKHRTNWKGLIDSGELVSVGHFNSGAANYPIETWTYGKTLDWLKSWFDGYNQKPDEIWVSCSILFNAFIAHEIIEYVKNRFPKTYVRIGGGYASLSPEDALKSGADDVYIGRIREADQIQPTDLTPENNENFNIFRLTCGCPNNCAFCINGKEKLHKFQIDNVVHYINETHTKYAVKHFNNWDPNVIRFKPHLIKFLNKIKELDIDISLRFDMGLEPELIDDKVIEALKFGKVEAFTIPIESVHPDFADFFDKPYTVISSIRALEKLTASNYDVSNCHGTSIIGYPDEQLIDIFTVFHIIKHYKMLSTPFPIVVLPNSPVDEKYGHLLKGKPYKEYNGHLFPLLKSQKRVNLYRKLILVLTASKRSISDNLIKKFPENIQNDYEKARTRAEIMIDEIKKTDAPDSVELLAKIYSRLP